MSLHLGQHVCFEERDEKRCGTIVSLTSEGGCKVAVRTSGGLYHYYLKTDEVTPNEASPPPVPPALVSAVNHPQHYNSGKIEVIDAIEDWKLGFSLGNAVKYIARAEHKGKHLEDLKKAAWYLAREIKRLEGK